MADQTPTPPKQEAVIVQGTPVAPVPATPTKKFRLRPGYSHTHGTQALTAGDEVELTEVQAHAFADRFEAVDTNEKFVAKDAATSAAVTSTAEAAQPSAEAVQAQEDKRTAERKAAEKMGVGGDAVRTVDSTKGTVKSDPDGTAQKL